MNANELFVKNILFNSVLRFSRNKQNIQRFIIRTKSLKNSIKYENKKSMFVSVLTKYPNIKFGLHSTAIALAFPLVVKAWGQKDPKLEEKKILEEADRLFEESHFDKLNELLRSQPSWYDNCEVLWRVARCEFHLSKSQEPNSKVATELIEEAFRHVTKALELSDECGPAHKWAAILLNQVSTNKGTREKIDQVLNVKTHMEKAVKYSPNDPTAHYLLGEWHYSCNQVSWIERKLAGVIYSSIPESNLEIGLQALERAEQLDSDFYSKNKVLIAKTLVALNRDITRAKSILIAVIGRYKNSEKWDDIEAVKEAKDLLNKLGVKVTEINAH